MNARRKFLLNSGSLIAFSALPLTAQATINLQQTSLDGIVVYREKDNLSSAYAAVLAQAGMTLLPLANDPVRQWRDQVKAAVSQYSVPMFGLTDWADFQLMRELNGELRRHPVTEVMHDKRKPNDETWAVGIALKQIKAITYHAVEDESDRDETSRHGNLFSWEIA